MYYFGVELRGYPEEQTDALFAAVQGWLGSEGLSDIAFDVRGAEDGIPTMNGVHPSAVKVRDPLGWRDALYASLDALLREQFGWVAHRELGKPGLYARIGFAASVHEDVWEDQCQAMDTIFDSAEGC
ncbi:MAG: hypothetical protein AAGE52_37635 [Myxococcota bacterium]